MWSVFGALVILSPLVALLSGASVSGVIITGIVCLVLFLAAFGITEVRHSYRAYAAESEWDKLEFDRIEAEYHHEMGRGNWERGDQLLDQLRALINKHMGRPV